MNYWKRESIREMISMPIYEYRCDDCGNITEFIEGVGRGKVEKKCKYCGSERLKKIFSVANISIGGAINDSRYGKTCCGRDERCEKPPCSDDGACKR